MNYTQEQVLPIAEKHALYKIQEERERCENDLYEFVKAAWPYLVGSEFLGCWAIEAMCDHLEAVAYGHIKNLLINISPRTGKTSVVAILFPLWVWIQKNKTYTTGSQVRFLCASYAHDLSLTSSNKARRVIASPWFQRLWGHRFMFRPDQNTKAAFELSTGGAYLATSVTGQLLGLGGDILIWDDLNNTKEVESEVQRETVETFFRELRTTRRNDPKLTPMIGVQQRLHEGDASGLWLASGQDLVHLKIPMRFEIAYSYPTIVLPQYDDDEAWTDQRIEDGELMWPERFGEKEVAEWESELGPYLCTPGESPVLMADLSLKPISQIKVDDEVVGFTTDSGFGLETKVYKRRHLKPTKVLNVTVLEKRPIVKITLDSGRIVRCTPEHRWYVGRGGEHRTDTKDIRPIYRQAVVGRALMRVCPPELPVLTPEEQRLAGWLAGFFDGEGTVALCQKNNGDFRRSSAIRFYQGDGRNLPLCEKLETALSHFGFEFSYTSRVRSDRKATQSEHRNRIYSIKTVTGVPTYQRFLHIVQPTKWVERFIGGAFGTKWIQDKERVVSIEPDGEETVYALETETGNYVVWGLASANSAGRLQQRPTPQGGGIIKYEWWQRWDGDQARKYGLEWSNDLRQFPPFELVVASVDTAFGEKEENDFSAMTVWGVFLDRVKNRRVMLMHSWRDRLPLHGSVISANPNEPAKVFEARMLKSLGVVERVAHVCKKFNVKRILIEDRTRGRDVANELIRLYGRDAWGIQLVNPDKDKTSRTHAVVPLFADGAVWAPWLPEKKDPNTGHVTPEFWIKWANDVIEECTKFPKDKHDDLHDTVTQALGFLREQGILMRADESSAILEDEMTYKPQTRSVSEHYGV